jgi:hypothetical protein
MRGSWWIFVEVTTIVTSMASLTRKPRSKYWFACFRYVNGRQRRKSTGHTDREKALKVAEQFEQVGQRKLATQTVRETLAELYREIYSETLPVATVRKFINSSPTGFIQNNRKYPPERLRFTKRAPPSFSSFWALLPTWILPQ